MPRLKKWYIHAARIYLNGLRLQAVVLDRPAYFLMHPTDLFKKKSVLNFASIVNISADLSVKNLQRMLKREWNDNAGKHQPNMVARGPQLFFAVAVCFPCASHALRCFLFNCLRQKHLFRISSNCGYNSNSWGGLSQPNITARGPRFSSAVAVCFSCA